MENGYLNKKSIQCRPAREVIGRCVTVNSSIGRRAMAKSSIKIPVHFFGSLRIPVHFSGSLRIHLHFFRSFRIGEITKSSISFPFFQNHTMTYNIILSFFTISSILKCHLLNHTQLLYDITISSILFAFLLYIILVKFQRLPSLSSTALVVLRGVQRTNMNVRHRVAMK